MAKSKYVRQTAPYIRSGASVEKMMRKVLISLLPVTAMAIYHFGFSAVRIILASIITMVLVEYLWTKVRKEQNSIGNLSAVISGLIFGLILPDATPTHVIIISAMLAIILVKLMFGGLGNNIFNIAAVARIIVAISYSAQVGYVVDTVSGATALQTMAASGFDAAIANYPISALFTGLTIPGCIGETSAIAILLGAIILIVSHAADYKIILSYVVTFSVLAFAAGMGYGNGASYAMSFMLFNLFSGGILFGATFMATDPVTAPVLDTSKIYYGFGLGLLTILIRLFGALPEGVVFSIILMNMCVPALEYYQYSNRNFTKRSITIFSLIIVCAIFLLYLGVR